MPAFLYPRRGRGFQASCLEEESGTVEYRGSQDDHYYRQDACVPIPRQGKRFPGILPGEGVRESGLAGKPG